MANVLSLALKINADASGLNLTPVERALKRLGDETDKVTSVFDKFSGTSEAAAAAQERTSKSLNDLIAARRAGTVTATEFAEQFEAIAAGAREEAAALQRAAQITEQNLSPLERYDRALAELDAQLQAGRISQETYTRATQSAAKGLTDAERAARGFEVATEQIQDNAAKTTLQFNELSGVFSVLPGPLGNIAGRISGLASAGEGLSRIFAGGLAQGFTGLAASVTALVNPVTLALAGITAFAAGATAVARGLIQLEDRVERLGNLANQLGVSFGFVQVLEEAGNRTGVSIENVSSAFARLQRTLTESGEGSKTATEALDRLGLSVADLDGLTQDQRIELLGQRIAAIEDPTERATAAVELFGRSGVQLLPFFNQLGAAADDLERFGAAISDEDKARIDDLGTSFDGLFVAIRGLGQNVLAPFAGIVGGIVDALASLIGVVNRVTQVLGFVLKPILDGVGATLSLVADGVNAVSGFFASLLGTTQDAAAESAGAVADTVEQSAEAIEKLDKAIADSNKGLDSAIAKAGEFGQAGFDAAFEFQTALEDLQEQANDGELNAEQYARGVALATAEYEKQIESAKRVAEETKRLAEEAQRRADAEAAAVQRIIDANLEQLRVDEQFGGDSNRARAAGNLSKLLTEQARVEEQLASARAAGDQAAINALTSRLATLDQVAARERDIASGAAKAREEAAKAAEEAAKEVQRIAQQRDREIERVNEQILAKQEEFAARQFEIELARAEELASVRSGSIQINDIREGGIGAFFETLQEDPAIAEARKQRQELEKIRKEIAKLNAEKVDILAGTG